MKPTLDPEDLYRLRSKACVWWTLDPDTEKLVHLAYALGHEHGTCAQLLQQFEQTMAEAGIVKSDGKDGTPWP